VTEKNKIEEEWRNTKFTKVNKNKKLEKLVLFSLDQLFFKKDSESL